MSWLRSHCDGGDDSGIKLIYPQFKRGCLMIPRTYTTYIYTTINREGVTLLWVGLISPVAPRNIDGCGLEGIVHTRR